MFKRTSCVLSILLMFSLPLQAQQREVSGRVTNARTGTPLIGANVMVVGTSQGTLTDNSGSYTLRLTGSAPVRIRAAQIGFKAQELENTQGQQVVNFALQEDVLNLEGVVVTGQATTVARRNLANAVATVSGDELTRAPAPTVDKALQGKIAGATISSNSGAPGGGVQVNLRGVSSINGASEPLWVIDGVPVSNVAISSGANAVTRASAGSNASNQDGPVNRIADLNPADIERIEVLKGASAAAIYGSRASNGVILVTTKRGGGGAPRVSVSQGLGTYRLSNTLGMRDWTRDEAVGAFGPSAGAFFGADDRPLQVVDLERALAGRSDLSRETSVSVSGGTQDGGTRYYASGLWLDENGVIENTGFSKQSLRLNLDQRLGDRINFGANTNIIHSLARRGLTNNDNTGTSYWMVFPFTPNFVDLRRQADGTFPVNPFERSNPFQTAALMDNDEDVWRLISAGHLDVNLLEAESHSLNLRVSGGADYFQQKNALFFPPELQFEPLDQQPGTSMLGNSDNLNLSTTANVIHALRDPSGRFTATSSAGIQFDERDLNVARTVARNLVGGQRTIAAGASAPEVFFTRDRVRDLGVYFQEELLTLDERLMLTGSVRADRSSANGDPDQFFFYPKASASYRITSPFARFDEVKLRTAYGETGNQPLFGQKFTSLSATNNIQGLPGLIVFPVAGDPNIRPERTREIEGGMDVMLLDGLAGLEVTLYTQQITDLLLQRTVAPSSGFQSQIFNGGRLDTRGVEVALAASPVRTAGFEWVSRTTFSSNRSRIAELPVLSFRTGGFGTALGAFQIEEGKSATQIVANVIENGQVVVRAVGDANPDFRMNFSNDLRFGAVSLSGLLNWQQGGNVINLTKLLFDFGQNTRDYLDDPQPGIDPQTGAPILGADGQQITTTKGQRRIIGFGRETRPYIEDGSFVKLRELTLAYQVPARILSRVPGGAKRAQISLSGRNLLTFTSYTGLDPEVSNFGNQSIARNIDVAPFPPSRSLWFSINMGF